MKMNQNQLKEFVIKTLKENGELMNESNWISGAVKHPGELKKDLGVSADNNLTPKLINQALDKLKEKDEDPDKPGIQGLTHKDLHLLKRLNLAKTLARLRNKKK